MNDCDCRFPEEYLSGYLDGVLTQEDMQRVRLRLEDCEVCAAELEALRRNREATMSTKFKAEDLQWDETPRAPWSRWSRNLGLTMLFLYLVSMLALAVWQPEELPDVAGRVVGGLGVFGTLFVFASVLIDRLVVAKTDRYRGVKK
ncbi:MAG: hypothetical protein AAGK22_13525 [Acidobacteriota bacterium]